jgi:hypothetical protein
MHDVFCSAHGYILSSVKGKSRAGNKIIMAFGVFTGFPLGPLQSLEESAVDRSDVTLYFFETGGSHFLQR